MENKKLLSEFTFYFKVEDKCYNDFRNLKKFLSHKGLKEIQIKEMIEYVESFGFYCDCEICLNFDKGFK